MTRYLKTQKKNKTKTKQIKNYKRTIKECTKKK